MVKPYLEDASLSANPTFLAEQQAVYRYYGASAFLFFFVIPFRVSLQKHGSLKRNWGRGVTVRPLEISMYGSSFPMGRDKWNSPPPAPRRSWGSFFLSISG